MANGFFSGGLARGADRSRARGQTDRQLRLNERVFETETRLKEEDANRDKKIRLTKASNEILATVDGMIDEMRGNNIPTDNILAIIKPLAVEAAQGLEAAGGNPQSALDRIRAKLSATASAAQVARTKGQATATEATSQVKALTDSGVSTPAAESAAGIGEPDRNVATVRLPQPDGSTIVMQRVTDKQGNLISETQLSRGFTTVVQPTELPASKAFDVKARVDNLNQGVQLIDEALALPEGTFGSVATITRGLREITRVGGELAKAGLPDDLVAPITKLAALGDRMITKAQKEGRLSPEVAKILNSDDLTDAQILETRLAFIVANTLQPTGRLLKDSLNEAREITKLSGFLTSEETARERLGTIRNILKRSAEGLGGSAGAADIPEGFEFSRTQDGKTVIRSIETGEEFIQQ